MRRVKRNIIFGAMILVTTFAAVNGFAQTSEEFAWCWGANGFLPKLIIRGCTAIIQASGKTDKVLSFAFNNRGMSYRFKVQYERAIADYDQAIKLEPRYAKAWNNRGVAYRNMGDVDRAIADYSEAIRLNPYYTAVEISS
jgi:tetratricopeptide (TPR) repeat protein